MGLLKSKYPEIFYLKQLIQPGDVCIDIGANLGYYSTQMAKSCGTKGKIIAFEPIPTFAEVFKKNTKKYPQIQLQQVALGESSGTVKMGIPMKDGVIRHGLTKVMDEEQEKNTETAANFEVQMVPGDEVIAHHYLTDQIKFIKCDVEGYEQFVIPSFEKTITKSMPIIQIELSGKENRQKVIDYLTKKGYIYKILKNNTLVEIAENDIFGVDSDFYFVPLK